MSIYNYTDLASEENEALIELSELLGESCILANSVDIQLLSGFRRFNYSFSENGRIDGLNISYFDLEYFPSVLNKFKYITSLNLSGNQITNINPISELKQITRLCLSNNRISDIRPIKSLNQITHIDLSDNQISDIHSVETLEKITSLKLSKNKITVINPIWELKQITQLYLSQNYISNISPIRQLKQITQLHLSSNRISDISPLEKLKNITHLNLNNNPTRDITAINGLKQITQLNLSKNLISDISPLNGLKQISQLNLSINKLSDLSPLRELKQISHLNLSGNLISNIGPLKELKQISYLNLSGNLISNIGPLKELKEITYLDLSSNRISNIDAINELSQITRLYLENNQISDLNPIKELKQISQLNLSKNQISDINPINELTKISKLYINNNQIIDITPIKDLKQISQLFLSDNQVSDITPLKELREITMLYIANNQIVNISPLEELKQISQLNLSGNQISDLNPIKELKQISLLYLTSNKVSDIRPIKELKNISQLHLINNQIRDIYPIMGLKQITDLNLSGNFIDDITSLKELKQISQLYLYSNRIRNISPISELNQITRLSLENNQITDISPIRELKELKLLNIQNNPIKKLDKWICETGMDILWVANYKYGILLYDNPLESPPVGVVKQGKEAMKKYFEGLEKGKDYLYEIKMLIVGEPEAGKTSLRVKLKDENARLPEKDASTRGIDIDLYTFEKNSKKYKVNLWDFGGQDILYSTHHFFLTHRSLYALVHDTRSNKTDFNYWIEAIGTYGGSSPIFIIQNERDGWSGSIDIFQYQAHFKNLKQVLRTNLLTLDNFSAVKSVIEAEITGMEHIGMELPKQWVEIRNKLADIAITEPYISLEDYFKICQSCGIDKNGALEISGIFHDLGVLLHFTDNALLRHTVFLRNSFVTEAVYRLIDYKPIQASGGDFTKYALKNIWNEKEYADKLDEILELTQEFELCYEYPDRPGDSYVFVPHIDKTTPKHGLDFSCSLKISYKYYFLPRGHFCRLLVRLHYYLKENLMWRSGIILERGGACAEITEKYDEKEILVKVSGQDKQEFLAIILDEFDRLNKGMKGVEKLVPCNCSECAASEKQHSFEYDKLKKALLMRIDRLRCGESLIEVPVAALLRESGFTLTPEGTLPEPKPEPEVKVFISYAHEDVGFVTELKKFLKALKRNNIISTWYDHDIIPGQLWDEIIKDNLKRSDIALFMLSQDFIDSDYIHATEIKEAIKRCEAGETIIIPINCKAHDKDALPILNHQGLPEGFKPIEEWEFKNQAYLSILEGIKKAINDLMETRRVEKDEFFSEHPWF